MSRLQRTWHSSEHKWMAAFPANTAHCGFKSFLENLKRYQDLLKNEFWHFSHFISKQNVNKLSPVKTYNLPFNTFSPAHLLDLQKKSPCLFIPSCSFIQYLRVVNFYCCICDFGHFCEVWESSLPHVGISKILFLDHFSP